MNKNIEHVQSELAAIKAKLDLGKISYDQAKRLAEPYLKILNNKATEIAKRFRQKPKLIQFGQYMR